MAAQGVHTHLSSAADAVVNIRPSMKLNKGLSSTGLTANSKHRKHTCGCRGLCKSFPRIVEYDVCLVGGGIMSATVGLMMKQLEPNCKIVIFERLGPLVAEESSNGGTTPARGTPRSASPNYTPSTPDDGVDVSKAIDVNENWHLSRQYWAYWKDQASSPTSLLARPRTRLCPWR